jgi:hypothetical protein
VTQTLHAPVRPHRPLSKGDATGIVVGRTSDEIADSGYFFSPYIPMQVTPTTVDPADFSIRRPIGGSTDLFARLIIIRSRTIRGTHWCDDAHNVLYRFFHNMQYGRPEFTARACWRAR